MNRSSQPPISPLLSAPWGVCTVCILIIRPHYTSTTKDRLRLLRLWAEFGRIRLQWQLSTHSCRWLLTRFSSSTAGSHCWRPDAELRRGSAAIWSTNQSCPFSRSHGHHILIVFEKVVGVVRLLDLGQPQIVWTVRGFDQIAAGLARLAKI